VSTKQTQWLVFDDYASGRLFPAAASLTAAAAAPAGPAEPAEHADIVDDEQLCKEDIEQLQSYAVVEHEISLIASNPALANSPSHSLRLLALESRRDAMDLRFQLGQLTFGEYLNLLRKSLFDTKNKALEAKRAGCLEKARYYMSHVQIIEKEISSADE
jgi:hypothetical protein